MTPCCLKLLWDVMTLEGRRKSRSTNNGLINKIWVQRRGGVEEASLWGSKTKGGKKYFQTHKILLLSLYNKGSINTYDWCFLSGLPQKAGKGV